MRPNAAVFVAAIALLAGCVGERIKENSPTDTQKTPEDVEYEEKQIPRIRESFDRMKAAMVAGDTRTYYDLFSSSYRRGSTYDDFVREHTAQQNGWRELWRDAEIRRVRIDPAQKEKASTLVRWGTPGPRIVEWILEDGVWKWNFVVPE